MADLFSAAHTALLNRIGSDAGVQSVLGHPVRVYDQRPAMAAFPFAVCERSEGRDIGAKGLQVQTLLLSIDVFSRQRSGIECRNILAALRSCLHDTAISASIVRCQEEAVLVAFDSDTQGTHGLARYRIVLSG